MSFAPVTYIDDLMDLDDESAYSRASVARSDGRSLGSQHRSDGRGHVSTDKFIRTNHDAPPESGMSSTNRPPPKDHLAHQLSRSSDAPPRQGPQFHPMIGEGLHPQASSKIPAFRSPQTRDFNCLDVAKHVENCPVCGKLYVQDNTICVVTILILSVLCILLLRKCLKF